MLASVVTAALWPCPGGRVDRRDSGNAWNTLTAPEGMALRRDPASESGSEREVQGQAHTFDQVPGGWGVSGGRGAASTP
ncbi:Hypothetical protein HVPorG_04232 [Roseomonas mucosa]|nr:Hypothetical protein HVPorG_04232 [Roseomonas mucosa]